MWDREYIVSSQGLGVFSLYHAWDYRYKREKLKKKKTELKITIFPI